jgi:hypothetical protein
MTREEVIKLVQDSDLSDSAKKNWVSRILEQGLTQEILDDIKAAFQIEIDKGFEQLGIDISDTPEYKEHEAKMVEEVEAAAKEYGETMDGLEKEEKELEKDTAKAIDDLAAQAIRDQIT